MGADRTEVTGQYFKGWGYMRFWLKEHPLSRQPGRGTPKLGEQEFKGQFSVPHGITVHLPE